MIRPTTICMHAVADKDQTIPDGHSAEEMKKPATELRNHAIELLQLLVKAR